MVDEVIVETSLKERRKAFWGYMTPMDAFDAMISACVAIEADGDPLNRETLKKRSGVTYNNALATTLARGLPPSLSRISHTISSDSVMNHSQRSFP